MRTVVFLKGCPLKCAWCSTPESQKLAPEVYYRSKKCVGCGKCIKACKLGALSFDEQTHLIVRDNSKCVNCGACAAVCPTKAQSMYGKMMTVKEVMRHIHRDEVFFFHSGGGVTLSGGDVLLQADFAQAILKECQDSAINTMAELDMYGDYENVAKLLPYLNGFYVDIKLMDPEEHKKWTGRSNETILRNIRMASENCAKDAIHPRVPLIWGVNDSRENILATAKFCSELKNCAQLEFLPYHRLGQVTYEYLGREYAFRDKPAMTSEQAMEKVAFLNELDLPFPVLVAGADIKNMPHT